MRQTKLASFLVNFWAHYNIVYLIWFDALKRQLFSETVVKSKRITTASLEHRRCPSASPSTSVQHLVTSAILDSDSFPPRKTLKWSSCCSCSYLERTTTSHHVCTVLQMQSSEDLSFQLSLSRHIVVTGVIFGHFNRLCYLLTHLRASYVYSLK